MPRRAPCESVRSQNFFSNPKTYNNTKIIQLSWYNLTKSGYFHIFTKIWTLPCPLCTCAQWTWVGAGPKNFFSKMAIHHRKLCRNFFFGIFSTHLRYLPLQVALTLHSFGLHVSHFTQCLYFCRKKSHYTIPSVYMVLIPIFFSSKSNICCSL